MDIHPLAVAAALVATYVGVQFWVLFRTRGTVRRDRNRALERRASEGGRKPPPPGGNREERVMLEINPETVCFIAAKLREFQVKEEVTIPEVPGSPTDDWALQVLADHLDDYCYQEIVTTVKDLEPLQQVHLVALMWTGRGDFELEEWDEAVCLAKSEWTPRTGDYLSATPLAADYLEEALSLFGHSCQD